MERIVVLEKLVYASRCLYSVELTCIRNNNKLLEYCHSMVRWSQSLTTINVVSSSGNADMTPPSEEEGGEAQ